MEIYEKIYNLFMENNIKQEDILYELTKTCKYLEAIYFKQYNYNQEILYHLKDLIWYNLENDIEFGISNIKSLGNKFKIIQQLDNNLILNLDNLMLLSNELNYLINNWNVEWKVVKLYKENNEKFSLMDDVIIFNKDEHPRKYNYFKKTGIIDKNNQNIYLNKDSILCKVDSKLGDSYLNNLIYNDIINLREICNSCINDKACLIIKKEE